jgi:hypothetical protein
VYFGLLSLPIHFIRTRRSAVGALLGFGAAVLALGVNWMVSEGVDLLPDEALGAALLMSLAGFTAAMTWRSRRGGFWYQSARGR